jgi:hypothetical protein
LGSVRFTYEQARVGERDLASNYDQCNATSLWDDVEHLVNVVESPEQSNMVANIENSFVCDAVCGAPRANDHI